MPIYADSTQFKTALQKIGRKVDERYANLLRATMLAIIAKTAQRTPVKTGRAAGSWGIQKGTPGSYMVPEGEESSAEEAIDRARQVSFKYPYGTWYIYNNVPYIDLLEFEGYSQQAPGGMLRLTLAETEFAVEGFLNNVLSE